MMLQPSLPMPRLQYRSGIELPGTREVAEEAAIAMVYNGQTHAVLMATPADLEDFAAGFSLTEGMITRIDGLRAIGVVEHEDGIELRMRLALGSARGQRRRATTGGSACGLCGIESLAEAVRLPDPVFGTLTPTPAEIAAAVAALRDLQPLGRSTRAVHAAGLWTRARGLDLVREDVGRHNALDKLAGAAIRQGRAAHDAIVVLTSRVSVEMVQKAARLGAPVIAAVSAPTSLAIRAARAAGITLAAIVRDDGFELFT